MGKKFNGFVLGAAVGSIAALLFAPKSGRELRQELNNKANEQLNKQKDSEHQAMAEDVTAQLKEQTETIARQLQETQKAEEVSEESIVIPVSETVEDEIKAETAATNNESIKTEN